MLKKKYAGMRYVFRNHSGFKKLFACAALLFCLSGALFAFGMDEQALQWTDESVKAIYNLDFDRAELFITRLEQANPDFPIALFGRTMIQWSRFEYEYEKSNPAAAKKFEESINASLSGIRTWIKNNQPDAYAYLALGGVYGVKGRFELANRSYISAYFSGRKGIKYMDKAARLNPQMYDAYLGQGVYQYYAGTLPAVVKILAKLVISGNANKGIEYLNLVMNKGRFCADSAKLLLVEIFIESDKYYNPALAARYIGEIIKKYPKNPLYKFVDIIAQYENKNYDKAIISARDFLARIGKEKFYSPIYTARTYTAIGTAQMAKGQYAAAADTFARSITATASQEPSRWQMWNMLRYAQVLDISGRRGEALALYNKIIRSKQNWGIDDIARPYLKKPYAAGVPPGHMSPP